MSDDADKIEERVTRILDRDEDGDKSVIFVCFPKNGLPQSQGKVYAAQVYLTTDIELIVETTREAAAAGMRKFYHE